MKLSSLIGLTSLVVLSDLQSTGQVIAQVGCGATISQNTTLNSDLTNCNPNGLLIGAPNITLDLGGHTLDGVGLGNGVDNTQGYDGVIIRNGVIREFDTGVSLNNADQNRLRDLVVSYNNANAISLSQSNNNRIEKNSASDNMGNGIFLSASDNNRIERNTTSDNDIPGSPSPTMLEWEMDRTAIGLNRIPPLITRILG